VFEPQENTLTSVRPTLMVALQPGHLVVTTAMAVDGRTEVTITLPSGGAVVASVVSVDMAAGTAVLRVPAELTDPQYQVSDLAMPIDGAMAMSPDPRAVSVYIDEQGTPQVVYGDGDEPDEASLVLDGNGRLLGMCSRTSGRVHLVAASALMQALNAAMVSETAPTRLGMTPLVDMNGDLTVHDVVPDGPAAQSGLLAGDIVRAVDGVPIAGVDGLTTALAQHPVDQPLVLTAARANVADPVQISVPASPTGWAL
jgi:S1-C subfamily serine protease